MAIGSKLRPNLKTRPDRRVFLCRKKWPQHGESWGHSFASNGDFAAGSRCLIPAAPAVPAAAAKQQNDKYDDEKRGGIHCRTPPGQRPACFRTSRMHSQYNQPF